MVGADEIKKGKKEWGVILNGVSRKASQRRLHKVAESRPEGGEGDVS